MIIDIIKGLFDTILKLITNESIYRLAIIVILLYIANRISRTKNEVSRFTKQDKIKIKKAKRAERKEKRKEKKQLRKEKKLARLQMEVSNEVRNE